eukprot:CAMPEP_0183747120 /NCGR_PEP_ID=MMETSP0737-20130205/67088_1 /TAXON_ID=385413 /ORGANISM="Thalassiosira miniscula, Strain CCMP1093" /LENGTH=829 /DNA_ID=CAMNT_0025982829 /DNA_START=908 /DNA_END=3398 /DNA_ORIENTATION=-
MAPNANSNIELMESASDLENGGGATDHIAGTVPVAIDGSQQKTTDKNGRNHLRWTRITKTVEIKEGSAGLLRGSIADTKNNKALSDNKNAKSDEEAPKDDKPFKKNPTPSKTILNGVSGAAAPGQVLALMGPSGSGKTSVLDVLSGRSTHDSGLITLDGEIVTERIMKKLKKKVAYVKQSDLFFDHLTVRDQLTYTAFLRLPSDWPKARKVAEVDRIIAQLRLTKCAETPIFMISGGEKKRVNIGTELLGEIVTERIMKKLKKKVAYVKQSDLFFDHLTVRDQLTYTAFLRLPSDWPKARKVAEVDRIIAQLRLTKCAETPIFMISGGEKKRVNIGTELLTDPSIILLDEPTSGLDSTSAVALMRILHALAKEEGKTIITSIHQPSSAVFFGFDKLMLLADGNVVYFGTPRGSLEHVKKLGLECPAGYNAADHHMDLLVVDSAMDEDGEKSINGTFQEDDVGTASSHSEMNLRHRRKSDLTTGSGITTKQKLIDSWDNEASATHIEEETAKDAAEFGLLQSVGGSSRSLRGKLSRQQSIVMTEKSFNSTWWTQYKVLVHRSMKNSRSAIFTMLNLIKAGAIGFMCGLLWFQMPYTESTVFDRSSYYFFTMTFWVFDAMFTAYMTFPLERAIIFKERSSGAYQLSAYFLAKTTSEAPARLVLPSIYMVISYWMSGVNNNFVIFLGSTCCSLLSVLAGESIGLFMGAAILDMERGMVVMTIITLALMVVGGFFVQNVPSWMLWMGYLSPFKYSYNSSVQLVFDKPVPCDGSGVLSVCNNGSTGYASEQEVLDFLGVEFSAGLNASLLLVMFIVVRIMAFFALKSKKAEERM